ncbi:MAG: PQQ-binding-like beta-propeller repeat protein [Thermoguttaceae bacterium]
MSKNLTVTLLASLIASASMLSAAESPPGATPPNVVADPPKFTHDWPGYNGPDGTFADQSRVPLLDDLSQARLVWTSEQDDLGYGKTSSHGGHTYGPKSHPSGSCSLIVAGGRVIVTYFSPKNSVVADDVILALDAATGKSVWKQVYAGKGFNRGAGKHPNYGPTPAAGDGKVFHLGTSGRVYAVDLATGKPLWESDVGDYPEHYRTVMAGVPVRADLDLMASQIREPGRKAMRSTVCPLTVIDGVAMVPADRLYAFETATGKELWKLDGASRVPSPAVINGKTYALCSGADQKMRLVEPKTGKVLWTEPIGISFNTTHGFIVADGKAFVPYKKVANVGHWDTAPLAAFALSEIGPKLLWQTKDEAHSETYFAYRDGVLYANLPDKRVKAFKADDGTLLSDLDVSNSMSIHGHLHLWGDRLVLIGDDCHESLAHVCYYQSCTAGAKDLRLSGQALAPRTFKQYHGVGGYECWMRPAFADGFMFTRSVNKETGQGAILCWDLRAQPAAR